MSWTRLWQRVGLRGRFIALLLVALLPIGSGWIYEIYQDIEDEIADAGRQVENLSALIAERETEILSKSHALLEVLGEIPAVVSADTAACHEVLRRVSQKADWQSALWIAAPSGRAICGSLSQKLDLDASSRDYFQRALATRAFTVSDYLTTKLRQHPAIVAALPLPAKDGGIAAVAMSTIDLAQISRSIRSLEKRPHAVLMVDGAGVVLDWQTGEERGVAQPPLQGVSLEGSELAGQLARAMGAGARRFQAHGPDGVMRIWGFKNTAGQGSQVLVGASKAEVVARGMSAVKTSLVWTLTIIAGVIGFSLIGWEVGFMRHLKRLAGAANRIGQGELAVRSNLPSAAGELIIVGHALDSMAEKLASKNALLTTTLQTMDQGLLSVDGQGRIQIWNTRFLELLGLPEGFVFKGMPLADLRQYQIEHDEFCQTDYAIRETIMSGSLLGMPVYERERPNGTVLEIRTVPFKDGGIVRSYTDVTARKLAERQLEHMARHDALTGLPNRLLLQELARSGSPKAIKRSESYAVLCLDLDRFKIVNDTLGHAAGDGLLKGAVMRITGQLHAGEHCVRIGGDEFAIVLRGKDSESRAEELAGQLVASLSQPFHVGPSRITIGVSIGLASGRAAEMPLLKTIKHADLALYRAKSEGRSTWRRFNEVHDGELQRLRVLELDIRQALENREFALHYQPLYNLLTGQITGFEALLRWEHPERGAIAPSEFIPMAESAGLMPVLGDWVLRHACEEARRWPCHIRLCVNVSALQFEKAAFVSSIVAALAASGLPASRLELEITETALISDHARVAQMIAQIRILGVTIAMDDFGVGYSSLDQLRHLPVDRIKIDRSFVHDIGRPASFQMVQAILEMAGRLGLGIVAEGIETHEQLRVLMEQGCAEGQGFLFSRPLTAGRARKLAGGKRRIMDAA